jgi:hypothetical protein
MYTRRVAAPAAHRMPREEDSGGKFEPKNRKRFREK